MAEIPTIMLALGRTASVLLTSTDISVFALIPVHQ